MRLSKKQVKALLEVVSSDVSRPVLCHASVSEYKDELYLTATDSYKLVALKLSDVITKDDINKVVSRDDLVKWYKLASSRDYFTEETLSDLLKAPETQYPLWGNIMPVSEQIPQTQFIVNANYLLTMQTIAETQGLTWRLYDKFAPLVANDRNDNIYLVMPLKS